MLVAWAGIAAIATRVHEDLGERFRDGQIAADLLRPISLPAMVYARDLGRACAAFLVQALPLLALCSLAAPLGLPESPGRWIAWIAALFGAHLVNVAISFCLGVGAFRLGSATGLGYVKATLVSLFAGVLLPIELFGPGLRAVALALPFHLLGRTPSMVLLGTADLVPIFVELLAWAAILWALGLWLWWGYGIGQGAVWMHAKLTVVALVLAYHHQCARQLRWLREGSSSHGHVWYRWFNELPVLLLVVAVVLVVVKPF